MPVVPVRVYCISAADDDEHLCMLQKHTATLRRLEVLELADRSTVKPGSLLTDDGPVAEARVVLALLTPTFLCDDGCVAMVGRALARRQRVIPLRVLKCHMENSGLDKLEALPRGMAWIGKDGDAWVDVCAELRKLVVELPATGTGQAVLPPPSRQLGRDEDLRALIAQLAEPRPSIILGSAGLGKTTLLVTAMHDLAIAAIYGGRRYFVCCDRATTRDDVVLTVAKVLGVPVSPQLEQAVLSHLREEKTLLALDSVSARGLTCSKARRMDCSREGSLGEGRRTAGEDGLEGRGA